MSTPRVAHAVFLLAIAAILAATLAPIESPLHVDRRELPSDGPFPLANALLNCALFAPLGACLVWSGVRSGWALLIGAGLSVAIELSQLAIPGRSPTVSDVIANTAGTWSGIALYRTAPAWLRASGARARRLALAAAALAAAGLVATGLLFAPAPSDSPLYGHHAPRLGHLHFYEGRVLAASLDGIDLVHGPLTESAALRRRLRGQYELSVEAEAGPAPSGQAALLLLTDQEQREILLLGPDRADLVFRFHHRGRWLGLEMARVRLPGALRDVRAGEPLRVSVTRSAGDLCLGVGGLRRCGLGFTVGDGWLLLAPDCAAWAPLRGLLGAAWVGMLLFPLGYWGRPSPSIAAAWAAVIGALLFAPAATGLLGTPPLQLAGGACGALAGALAHRRNARLGTASRGGGAE